MDAETRRRERQRALAQALMGAQAPQGQMVGGFYVAPNPLERLATLGSQWAGGRLNKRLDQEDAQAEKTERERLAAALGRSMEGNDPRMASTGGTAMPPDPSRAAAIEDFQQLPLDTQRSVIGQQAVAKLWPKAAEGFTLSSGQTRYGPDGKPIVSAPAEAPTMTDDEREYERAKKEGFTGSFQDWILEGKRAGATNVNTAVNTERSLYGNLAGERAKEISGLYDRAVKSPELAERARRVRELVGPDSQALTGMGANWMLGAAKVANQLGIDTGDAAADTEVLMTQLAASTLDNIKSSGLGGGTGFSNADRDFLERVVGGKITLEAKTLARLAELNEKAALGTMQRWNAEAGRLDPQQLRSLGLGPIEMPKGTPPSGAQPKLQRNPDGSYTYTP